LTAPTTPTGNIIVGANGTVYIAATTAAAPTTPFGEDLDGAAWTDLGIVSDDGVTFSDTKTIVKIMGWAQKRPVRKINPDSETTVAFSLRQWNPTNVVFAFGNGSFTAGTYTPSNEVDIPEKSLAVAWKDNLDEFMLYFPRGSSGATVTFNLKRDENSALPVEFDSTPHEGEDAYQLITDSSAFSSQTDS